MTSTALIASVSSVNVLLNVSIFVFFKVESKVGVNSTFKKETRCFS